jgi:hypothetical protein
MAVFHAVPAKAIVTLYEEQFIAYALHNFNIQTMATTFGG